MTQSPRHCASVDIGTNSVKLLIAEVSETEAHPLFEQSFVTRLGEGMQPHDRNLREAPMRRTLDALDQFVTALDKWDIQDVVAVGTAALRDAQNSADFLKRALERTGITLEIISGEEEARLSYLAVRLDPLWRDHPALTVVDVGGGSTEIIEGEGERIVSRRSVNWGAVKLTETFLRSDPPTITQLTEANRAVEKAFAQVALVTKKQDRVIVGVGGTITNLASMDRGRFVAGEELHGYALSHERLEDQITHLAALNIEKRAELGGLDPKRADIIVGGAILLSQALSLLNGEFIAVSVRGLRWGALYDRFRI